MSKVYNVISMYTDAKGSYPSVSTYETRDLALAGLQFIFNWWSSKIKPRREEMNLSAKVIPHAHMYTDDVTIDMYLVETNLIVESKETEGE